MMAKYSLRLATAGLVAVALTSALGCSGTPNGEDKDVVEYILRVILEKNLDSSQDILHVEYQRDGGQVVDGQVIVGGDAITGFNSSGVATKTYALGQWDTGVWVHILALDSSGSVVYSDSVIIPGEFAISDIDPQIGFWRPSEPNPRVEWLTSTHAAGYAISVEGQGAASSGRGFADYHESQTSLTQTFVPEVFSDNFDFVLGDYDIHIIAYNPNFLLRPGASYKSPEFPDIPTPIASEDVSGAISALTVTQSETLEVVTQ